MKNYSGDAHGADTYWTQIGKEYGVLTVAYTAHHMNRLTLEQALEVEEAYQKVISQINRPYLQPTSYSGKLVRRNYLQAKAGNQIFAIGDLKNGQVQGGTAYCVQYAKNMQKDIFFYDQTTAQWLRWNYIDSNWERWDCPYLTSKNTTVGTRKLQPHGIEAIKEVYRKTFN